MKFGHPIYRMAADNCKWCHADPFDLPLIYKRKFFLHGTITWKVNLNFFKKAMIDVIDDFKMPGQHPAEGLNRPGFQGFRHQGMVGKSDGDKSAF